MKTSPMMVFGRTAMTGGSALPSPVVASPLKMARMAAISHVLMRIEGSPPEVGSTRRAPILFTKTVWPRSPPRPLSTDPHQPKKPSLNSGNILSAIGDSLRGVGFVELASSECKWRFCGRQRDHKGCSMGGKPRFRAPLCLGPSKKKGMWMGGLVPMGYRAEEKRLVVEPTQAGT